MSFLSDLEKTLHTKHIIVFLGAVVLLFAVYNYSGQKGVVPYEPLQVDARSRQQMAQPDLGASSGANGYTAVDSMTGQVGGGVIVDAVFFEAFVTQIAPEDGRHAQFMSFMECMSNFLNLSCRFR